MVKYINKSFLAALGLIWGAAVQGQVQHEKFVQNIPNTSLSFSMEPIPGGVFRMGSDKSSATDEKPAHEVQISPFWMSTHEVTWDLFEAFLYKDYEEAKLLDAALLDELEAFAKKNGVDAIARPTKPYLDMTFGMGKQGQPAVGMTHYNAIQFCKWLYARTGVFYRLPTEAEWEYACRAGSEGDYYYGDDPSKLGEYAWFKDNSDNKTQKVGLKKPNAFGLYDMMGNVAEWTYDQYVDSYTQWKDEKAVDPVVVPTELYPHVVRGGSFESPADKLRSAARDYSDPVWKQLDPQIPKSNWWFPEAPFVGMRLVRPVTPPSLEEILAYYNQEPIEDF